MKRNLLSSSAPAPAWMTPELERQRCVSEQDFAAWIGQSVDTVTRLRKSGQGPRWIRVSERKIAYRVGDVIDWLNAGGVKDV